MRPCLLLYSGGIDSTTLLYKLLDELWHPHLLILNYGSKHNSKENEVAVKVAEELDLPYTLFSFPFKDLARSSLTSGHIRIPSAKENRQINTVVPFRNTVFLALASSLALSENLFLLEGKKRVYHIFISPVSDDYKNYRDCRPKYYKKLEKALTLGTVYDDQIIKIHTPFIKWDKTKIIKYGLKLGVDYKNTWTCYNGKERPCLKCDACYERQIAFYNNSIKDPLLTDKEWKIFLKDMEERNAI